MNDFVAVVGSLNRDIVLRVDHLPAPGETVMGSSVTYHRGGKGANQALAAARLGRPVAMVGKVGADHEGTAYLRALINDGVDVEGVSVDIDEPTGHAYILLDGSGENSIAVMPGANGRVGPEDVAAASRHLEHAAVTLAQLEIPTDAVKAAARLAGGRFVLNAAPFHELGAELLGLVDVLVVNRTELASLAGDELAGDGDDVAAQARRIAGPDAVVVTLGAQGALLTSAGGVVEVPAPVVVPVDTTGAGDAFCGALADSLARGEDLEEAVRWAVAAGAVATTKLGAQTALPDAAAVAELLSGQ